MNIALRLAAFMLMSSVALAQSPSPRPTPPVRLIKLPNGDYTVPLRELEGEGMTGKVTLHEEGPKTLVTVYVFGNGKEPYRFSLKSGSDCVHANGVVAPIRPAIMGMPAQTIVEVPITDFQSKSFAVDVQNASSRQEFKEVCSRL